MLEKPDLSDAKIIACLQMYYGLKAVEVTFLPLGFDHNTAVYRAVTEDGAAYFLKLRKYFDESAAVVPRFLSDHGVPHLMTPIPALSGQLWATVDDFSVTVYPFVEGRDGYDVPLSRLNWMKYGAALKGIHTAVLPHALQEHLPRETYSAEWREAVKSVLARVEAETFNEPIAAQMAELLRRERVRVRHLVEQAERLASALQAQPPEFVLCHGDMHPGNILITSDSDLYLVDWDNLVYAPKERDVMFMGQMVEGRLQINQPFDQGYGGLAIHPVALVYYRYERIVQDVTVSSGAIFDRSAEAENSAAELRVITNQFKPGYDVSIALETRTLLPPELQVPLPD